MKTKPEARKKVTQISAHELFIGLLLFFTDRGFREGELRQFLRTLQSEYPNAISWLDVVETCTGPSCDFFGSFLQLMSARSNPRRTLEFHENAWFRVVPSARPLLRARLEKEGLLPQFEADFRRLAARFDHYLGPWPQRREECSTAYSPGSAV